MEDGLFERDELRAGIDPELPATVREPAEGGQRRPAGPTVLASARGPSAAPGLAPGDPGPRLGEELEVMSRLERRVDTQLLGLAAHPVEPDGGGLARLPVFEVDERPPTPELQGPAEQIAAPLRLAEGELQARLAEQLLEPLGVDVTRRHLESIAVAGRLDRLAAERLAQSDDGTLHDLRR